MKTEERACGCACSGGSPKLERLTEKAAATTEGEGKTSLAGAENEGVGLLPAKEATTVSTRLTWADRLGGWGVRWKVRRMRYAVHPGMYAVGKPNPASAVLVTANYKLTFDRVRQALAGRDLWILVLDTRGINVWCAAGKGTFSTAEVVRQVRRTGLAERVSHRVLILPQLAAPGVNAHEVQRETGFRAVYGPVRAADIPAFLDNGRKAPPEMRRVTFTLRERLVLTPGEFATVMKYFLFYLVGAALANATLGAGSGSGLIRLTVPVWGALVAGTVVTPLLLPVLPFRSFSLKGWAIGLLWATVWSWLTDAGPLVATGNLLLLGAISAGFSLLFTGTATFTSQTGVNREIRLFARPIAATGLLGAACLAGSLFL